MSMYLLTLPEILGVFFLYMQGEYAVDIGFRSFCADEYPRPIIRDEEESDEPVLTSRYPLFHFYKEAGLLFKHYRTGTDVYCKDVKQFNNWLSAYLQAYANGELLPNGNFLKAEHTETEVKLWLDQYRNYFGNTFTIFQEVKVKGHTIKAPFEARIWEELLILHICGTIKLELADEKLPYYVEQWEWLETDVKILKDMVTEMTGAVTYLGIVITRNNRVYYNQKEISLKETSDEFKLLKYLVQHQGEPVSPSVVYKYLGYVNTQKEYYNESLEVHGHKLSKKLSLNEAKNQRLRSTITRLLKKLGGKSLKITASELEGVALKLLINS